MRTLSSTLLVVTVLSTMGLAAQEVIPLGQFRSLELHDGGTVIVRHGPVQRVTLLAGDVRSTRIRVESGQRLVIENCSPHCPRNYHLELEVLTPELAAVAVSNGGTVQSAGAFPVQAAIAAAVEQGGTIDIRTMVADAVAASVHQGGRIFTTPRQALSAAIASGGAITYWGEPRVT